MHEQQTLSEQLRNELLHIADLLEDERCRIFQQEVCDFEKDKEYVDSRLFYLQGKIREISDLVGYMDFKKNNEVIKEISVPRDCNGCFGASFGDCQKCERDMDKKEEIF